MCRRNKGDTLLPALKHLQGSIKVLRQMGIWGKVPVLTDTSLEV